MAGDPIPFFGRTNSTGVLRCDCALCNYGGQIRVSQRSDDERVVHPLWATDVPNRLHGATINSEGDVI